MPLYVDFESPATSSLKPIRKLLTRVQHVIDHDVTNHDCGPATRCLEKLPGGIMRLRCYLPSGYKPRMNRRANYLQVQISRNGYLFEVAECGNGTCYGWAGSSIPLEVCEIFLATWLAARGGEHCLCQTVEKQ